MIESSMLGRRKALFLKGLIVQYLIKGSVVDFNFVADTNTQIISSGSFQKL